MTTLERPTGTALSPVLPAVALVGAPLLIVLGNALHPVVAARALLAAFCFWWIRHRIIGPWAGRLSCSDESP